MGRTLITLLNKRKNQKDKMPKQYVLGIESTAHTFGIGIVKEGKIISNGKDSYVTDRGGIIPT